MRWHQPAALGALVLLLVGAGWSSKQELGADYRCTYLGATAGDTLYFPKSSYGVHGLGRTSASADSSRGVRWLFWGGISGTCSLEIYTPVCPGGVDTVIATNGSFLSSGTYGGIRNAISKVVVLGSGSIQVTGAD